MRTLYPCDETFEIGPFVFECGGHTLDIEIMARYAHRFGGSKIEHHSASPEQVGDCELRWWTQAPEVEK